MHRKQGVWQLLVQPLAPAVSTITPDLPAKITRENGSFVIWEENVLCILIWEEKEDIDGMRPQAKKKKICFILEESDYQPLQY